MTASAGWSHSLPDEDEAHVTVTFKQAMAPSRSCRSHRQPEPRGVGEGSYHGASGGSHAVARGAMCMSRKRAAAAARKEAGRAAGALMPMVRGCAAARQGGRGSRPEPMRTEVSGPAIGSIATAEIRSKG
jgi:hypothetical protein